MRRTTIILVFMSLFFTCAADTIRQTTDSDFYGGTLNGVSVVNTGSDAYLRLNSELQQMPGNSFIIAGSSDYPLYNTPDRLSMPFSVSKYLTVTAAVVFGQWQGTAGVYDCGIRADADQSGTSPSASSWLSPGSYNRMQNILGAGSLHYSRVTLSADAYLNSFTPYHLYLQGVTGLDASNHLRPRSTSPNNHFYASSAAVDNFQMVLQSIDNGLSWTHNTDSQPVFVIEYLDPAGLYLDSNGRNVSYLGNPYYSYQDRNLYGSYYEGQEFDISVPTTMTKVRVYVSSGALVPADDLYVVLQDITDPLNVLLLAEEVFISKTDIFPGLSWQSHTLTAPKNLQPGHRYRVFFKSPGSNSSAYYIMRGSYIYRNPSQDSVFSEAALSAASFGGRNSCLVYTTGAGTSWDDFNKTQDLLIMMSDSYSTVYEASGTFISGPFDTKGGSTFKKISWLPVTQTALTGEAPVKFQAAANNDNNTWDFIGPDGTSSTWFTNPLDSVFPGNFGNKRYIRYKMLMTTADVTMSPYMDEVTIEYESRPFARGDINLTNYPNPFKPGEGGTVVRYTLYEDSDVTAVILTPFSDIVRKYEIASGTEGAKGSAGGYDNKVAWDGRNDAGQMVGSGIYIFMLQIKSETTVYKRKIAVLR